MNASTHAGNHASSTQCLTFQGRPIARLRQPTELTEVFASSMWTWDKVAGLNVLKHRLACQVVEFFGVPDEIDLAGPLPGGVACEFLIVDFRTGWFE